MNQSMMVNDFSMSSAGLDFASAVRSTVASKRLSGSIRFRRLGMLADEFPQQRLALILLARVEHLSG
jgi:hypothetical protein